jgi:hypothetical protein
MKAFREEIVELGTIFIFVFTQSTGSTLKPVHDRRSTQPKVVISKSNMYFIPRKEIQSHDAVLNVEFKLHYPRCPHRCYLLGFFLPGQDSILHLCLLL